MVRKLCAIKGMAGARASHHGVHPSPLQNEEKCVDRERDEGKGTEDIALA